MPKSFWRITVYPDGSASALLDTRGHHAIVLEVGTVDYNELLKRVEELVVEVNPGGRIAQVSINESDYSYLKDEKYLRSLFGPQGTVKWKVYSREEASYDPLPEETKEFLGRYPIFGVTPKKCQ